MFTTIHCIITATAFVLAVSATLAVHYVKNK